MAKNLVYIGIAVLAVIAVVLGYQIYQQTVSKKAPTTRQQPPTRTITQPVGTQSSTQTAPQKTELTAKEKQVLNFPGPNASQEEKNAWEAVVRKLGAESEGVAYLDISGCKPNPVVYRVKLDSSFMVKNSDQKDHEIYNAKRVTIKANSTQTLRTQEIGSNIGLLGYGCDGSPGLGVGIIQIVP